MTRRTVWVAAAAAALTAAACTLSLAPRTPPVPIPPAVVRPLAVHTCVPGAEAWLDGAGVPSALAAPHAAANRDGYVLFPAFPGAVPDFNVHAAAADHAEYGVVARGIRGGSDGVDLFLGDCERTARGYPQPVQLAAWPSLVVRRFPPEHGPVHVCADRSYAFCDETNTPWGWQGASMFQLLGRQADGEDITPPIRWMQRRGANLARVFVQWNGHGDRLDLAPDFDAQLRVLIDRFASEGLRLELTAIANWRTPDEDRPIVQRVYDAAAGHWNVFVEAVNEPWVRGYDAVRLMRGVDRHGVLSAYGYQPDGLNGWALTAKLDYTVWHSPRDVHYPRNGKDVWEMRAAVGQPVVDDEPFGIADYRKDGSGARDNDLDDHVSHFATCRLYAAGCTIHSQAGLEGRAPSAAEPITDHIADAIGQTWAFLPASQTLVGTYSRYLFADFPLQMTGSDTFDGQGHAYAAISGGHAYVVVPKPTASWTPRLDHGWQVTATGPVPYVLEMAR